MSFNSKWYHILVFSGIVSVLMCCNSDSSITNNSKSIKANNEIQDHGCLASYELSQYGDTVNRTFADGTKHGHWIHYEFIYDSMKMNHQGDPNQGSRIGKYKYQEGEYTYGEKTGLWKTYDKEGHILDSLVYPNVSAAER